MHPQENPQGFRLSELEKKAHALLADSNSRIDERSFTNYDKSAIEQDLALVAEMKGRFEREDTPGGKETKKLSDIFELLLAELVELYDWLGDNVFIVNTSEYDDIVHGIDMVTEFIRSGLSSYLGMAIDVTFSKDQLEKKVRSVADDINHGKLVTIKYFQSGNGDIVGSLNNIPRIIIGASRKAIDELIEARLTLESLKQRKDHPTPSDKEDLDNIIKQIRDVKKSLADNPLQFEILEQILIQLKGYADYAAKVDQPEISEKYTTVLEQIRYIYDAKVKDTDLMRVANSRQPDQTTALMSFQIEQSLNSILQSPH